MTHDDDRARENLRLRAKGKRMPENREQFEYMARLYEKGALKMKEENSKLRHKVSILEARVFVLQNKLQSLQ